MNSNTPVINVSNIEAFTLMCKKHEVCEVFQSKIEQVHVFQALLMRGAVAFMLQFEADPTLHDPALNKVERSIYDNRIVREWNWNGNILTRDIGSRAEMVRALTSLGVHKDKIKEVKALKTSELVETLDQSEEEGETNFVQQVKVSSNKHTFETSNPYLKVVRLESGKNRSGQRCYKLVGNVDLQGYSDTAVQALQQIRGLEILAGSIS